MAKAELKKLPMKVEEEEIMLKQEDVKEQGGKEIFFLSSIERKRLHRTKTFLLYRGNEHSARMLICFVACNAAYK